MGDMEWMSNFLDTSCPSAKWSAIDDVITKSALTPSSGVISGLAADPLRVMTSFMDDN